MQTVNIVKTVNLKLTSTNQTGIISIFDNTLDAFDNVLAKSAFVKNLKAFAKITSLPPVRLPNFKLEDSESEKLYKALDIEFNSPRKQLDIFIGSSGDWSQIGSVSLLNPSGYPYRMYNLLDFATDGLAAELENGKSIGVQVVNVGNGTLEGSDTVTIHGSVTQEYVIPEKKNNDSVEGVDIEAEITDTPIEVVLSNENRKLVVLQNKGNNAVTICLKLANSKFRKGIVLKTDDYYELDTKNISYFGSIYAITDIGKSSMLSGIEFNYV